MFLGACLPIKFSNAIEDNNYILFMYFSLYSRLNDFTVLYSVFYIGLTYVYSLPNFASFFSLAVYSPHHLNGSYSHLNDRDAELFRVFIAAKLNIEMCLFVFEENLWNIFCVVVSHC